MADLKRMKINVYYEFNRNYICQQYIYKQYISSNTDVTEK